MPDAQHLAINTDIADWRAILECLTIREIAPLLHACHRRNRNDPACLSAQCTLDHEEASRRTDARLRRWGYGR